MTCIDLIPIERTYHNNGQHAEQVARFTLTGKIEKADNKPATECGDCGNIQIKSARATICKGTDLEKGLADNAATEFGYVISDFSKMYLMSKREFIEFAKLFSTVTRESSKNGGKEKLRFKPENKNMVEWLGRNI